MNSLRHIRKQVFGVTQMAFGGIVGVTQATVSKWEKGKLQPGLRELALIREAADAQGLPWEDSWFFAPPNLDADSRAEPEEAHP